MSYDVAQATADRIRAERAAAGVLGKVRPVPSSSEDRAVEEAERFAREVADERREEWHR